MESEEFLTLMNLSRGMGPLINGPHLGLGFGNMFPETNSGAFFGILG